jgi:phosphonate transport system permease protein
LIWALFFVAAVGLGPASGVAALACYSTGYLSRMYLDDFESLDMSVFRALRLSGASRLQAFQYGLWPQAQALIASNTLFILEYNIRTATILGIVGAGGVGYYLYLFMQQMDYPKATALLMFLVPVVSLLAHLSHRVRKSLTLER